MTSIKEAIPEAAVLEEPPKLALIESTFKDVDDDHLLRMLNDCTSQLFIAIRKPLPPGISVADIGIGGCSVHLERNKDLTSPNRVERAQRICRLLNARLKELFPAASRNEPRVVIHAMVVLASEGSRSGRIWAAEFGVGLAKLRVKWVLASSTGRCKHGKDYEKLFLGNSHLRTSSAGIGCADVCQEDAGDRALDKMTEAVAHDIFRAVKAHAK
jgi:hypothetical protein